MNQFYLFIFLFTITCIILFYQGLNFEEFVNIETVNGIISLDSEKVYIDVGNNTADDAVLKSNSTLYVKDKIKFGNNNKYYIDEELFKKIKSFSEIYYFDFKKNQQLCLKDGDGNNVCCDKVDLGVLTGQTPFKFKLAEPKLVYNNGVVNKDDIYDRVNVPKDKKKTSFYDKSFFMLPTSMTTTKNLTQLHSDIGATYTKTIFAKVFPDIRSDSSNTMMTGFPDKNYYCYLLNQSSDITTVV